MGFARLVSLGLVHFLVAVPSHAREDSASGRHEQTDRPVFADAVASELIQMNVEVGEMSKQTLAKDSGIQLAVIDKPSALSELSGGKVDVTPYECPQSQALQSTTDNAGVTKLQRLNVNSGEYIDVLVIPNNWTDPGFQSINSCAISPIDSIIHCSMEINNRGSFLVRIDMTQVAFVAKMPPWCYAATFDKDGNYWMYKSGGLSVIKDVASMPSYSSYSYLSGNAPAMVSVQDLGADLTVLYGDLDKSGNEGTYLLSVNTGRLQIVKVSTDRYEQFSLTNASGLPKQDIVWGSAWNFNNSIFFAGDSGLGVFRLDEFDIQNGSASFVLMGPAQVTNWNDGFSCIGKGTPWQLDDVVSYDCKGARVLQATTTNMTVPTTNASRAYFQYLDIPTGTYQLYYEVHKNWTDPPFNSINSCAINPMDSIIHCTMEIDDIGSFLVRIDETQVGFVAKVPGWMYAGVFDTDGTYYMYGNVGLSAIPKVVGMPAFPSYKQLGNGPAYTGPYALDMGGDMVVLKADWEGTGTHTYLLSVDNGMLLVARVTEGHASKHWKMVGTDLPRTTQTWGSAWSFKTKTYFAPDSGEAVYELMSIKLESGVAQFKEVGKSQATSWSDGLSCMCDISPFTAVDQ